MLKGVESSDLQGVYSEIAEVIGVDATVDIYTRLKGQQITFPARLYNKSYVIKVVNERYNGRNLKELAREFHYTERWLRTYLKR